jgi:hypothetical protein
MAAYEPQPTSVDLDQYETVQRCTRRTKFHGRSIARKPQSAASPGRTCPALIVCATSLSARLRTFGPTIFCSDRASDASLRFFYERRARRDKITPAKRKMQCPMMI